LICVLGLALASENGPDPDFERKRSLGSQGNKKRNVKIHHKTARVNEA
jgi:hypothetical protein